MPDREIIQTPGSPIVHRASIVLTGANLDAVDFDAMAVMGPQATIPNGGTVVSDADSTGLAVASGRSLQITFSSTPPNAFQLKLPVPSKDGKPGYYLYSPLISRVPAVTFQAATGRSAAFLGEISPLSIPQSALKPTPNNQDFRTVEITIPGVQAAGMQPAEIATTEIAVNLAPLELKGQAKLLAVENDVDLPGIYTLRLSLEVPKDALEGTLTFRLSASSAAANGVTVKTIAAQSNPVKSRHPITGPRPLFRHAPQDKILPVTRCGHPQPTLAQGAPRPVFGFHLSCSRGWRRSPRSLVSLLPETAAESLFHGFLTFQAMEAVSLSPGSRALPVAGLATCPTCPITGTTTSVSDHSPPGTGISSGASSRPSPKTPWTAISTGPT